jgi:regulator of cell morphogenesis and NO signaling
MKLEQPEDILAVELGQWVLCFPASLPTLELYSIDYCMDCFLTLGEIVQKSGFSSKDFIAELWKTATNLFLLPGRWFYSESPLEMVDFIVHNFHGPERSSIYRIRQFFEAACARQIGGNFAILKELQKKFEEVSQSLLQHMQREENVIFRTVREYPKIMQNTEQLLKHLESQIGPINHMAWEHNIIRSFLVEMGSMVDEYQLEKDRYQEFVRITQELRQFEKELKVHVFYENYVLASVLKGRKLLTNCTTKIVP